MQMMESTGLRDPGYGPRICLTGAEAKRLGTLFHAERLRRGLKQSDLFHLLQRTTIKNVESLKCQYLSTRAFERIATVMQIVPGILREIIRHPGSRLRPPNQVENVLANERVLPLDDITMDALSHHVRTSMSDNGWTQAKMARLARINKNTLHDLATKARGGITGRVLLRLAALAQRPLNDFLGDMGFDLEQVFPR